MGLTGISGPSGLSAIMGGGNGGGCSATINRSRALTGTEYFQAASATDFTVGDNNWTVLLWLWMDSLASTPFVFAKGTANTGANEEYSIFFGGVTSGHLGFSFNDNAGGNTFLEWGTSFGTGSWRMVELGFRSALNETFMNIDNGTEITGAFLGTPAINGNKLLTVGATSSGLLPLSGRIQQFLWFNGLLSAADKTAFYNSGAGGEYRNLTLSTAPAYSWPANEAIGNLIAVLGGKDLTAVNSPGNAAGHFLSCA